MFEASADDRGTVQALARELDEAKEDGIYFSLFIYCNQDMYHQFVPDAITFAFSPRSETQICDGQLYNKLLTRLKSLFPQLSLRSILDLNPTSWSVPLQQSATFYDYAIVNQHRYYASNRTTSTSSSLVEVVVSETGRTWVGELMDIIHINQSNGYIFTLGHIRWFRPLYVDISQTIWEAL